MNQTSLIILGAGNSAIEVIDLVNDINRGSSNKIKIVGVLDDNKKLHNKKILNVPILGSLKDVKKYKNEKLCITLFSHKNRFIRTKLIKSLNISSERFFTIIHPNSFIGKNSKIGVGCVVYQNSNIYSKSKIGNFCIINPQVSVAPFSVIENNCFIGFGTMIAVKSKIEKNTYVGNKSMILENIKIKEGSRVLLNSVVNKNFNSKYGIMLGSPAKIIAYEKKTRL